jgi:hypothetical protein
VWISVVRAIIATAVVVVAVFQDRIRAGITRPKLDVSIRVSPPDCHKTPMLRSSLKDVTVIASVDDLSCNGDGQAVIHNYLNLAQND